MNKRNVMIGAALAGIMAVGAIAHVVPAMASDEAGHEKNSCKGKDKNSCKGKDAKDKNSCKGKTQEGDKNACNGKNGCNGKKAEDKK